MGMPMAGLRSMRVIIWQIIMIVRKFTGIVSWPQPDGQNPVSYTHLTLPTICSV